jgi:MFS family permease
MTQGSVAAPDRYGTTFSAMRYPNYRRWFIGQVLSLMGTWMQSVAQGWLVYDLTGSKLALGTISFIGSLPTLVLMLPAGAVADRVSRRKMMLITQTVMMICAFILAFFTGTKSLQVWYIAVLGFILGIAGAFDAPARLALTVELVDDRRDLQNAIALNSTMFNLARVVGPAIGGLVLAAVGATWCFILNGLSFVAVLVALWGMHLNETVKPPRTRRMTAEIGDGLHYVWDTKIVRAMVALVAVTSIFGFSYSVLMPAYAVDVLGVGEAGLGALTAAVGAGALIGSLTVASLTRSRRKGWQLTFGSLLFPIALFAFALSRNLVLSLAILVVVGFGFIIQNTTSNTLVQMLVPDHLRGRVMSVYSMMFIGTMPIGSLLAGSLAQIYGTSLTIIFGASVTLLFALFVVFFIPQVRRLES